MNRPVCHTSKKVPTLKYKGPAKSKLQTSKAIPTITLGFGREADSASTDLALKRWDTTHFEIFSWRVFLPLKI